MEFDVKPHGIFSLHITELMESMDNREFPTMCIEKMDPKLYKAAMEGDLVLLTSIAKVDCPLDLSLCLDPQKNTALHIAVEFGHQNIVENVIELCPFLISQHNSKGDTPLHVAARAGDLELTKLLTPALNLNLMEGNPALTEGDPVWQAGTMALRKRNFEGSNPIDVALKKRAGKVALHLLAFEERHELGLEVNAVGESLLYLAAEAGLDEVVQKIIDSGDYSTGGPDGQNPLHIAVIKGQFGVVKILLDEVSNFIPQADHFGNTALHYASAKSFCRVLEDKDKDRPPSDGRVLREDEERNPTSSEKDDQIKILELLLKANPSLAYVPNKNGDYPLFIAIRKHFDCGVDTILDHCPDSIRLVNQKGQNALHLAVMETSYSVIDRLKERLDFKKLINEPDNDWNTPMHLATLTNESVMVENFICLGAPDLTMSNKEGLTAMDICGYTETEHRIRAILRKSGAVPGRRQWQEQIPIQYVWTASTFSSCPRSPNSPGPLRHRRLVPRSPPRLRSRTPSLLSPSPPPRFGIPTRFRIPIPTRFRIPIRFRIPTFLHRRPRPDMDQPEMAVIAPPEMAVMARPEMAVSREFKTLGLQMLPIVTSLVATVTFAAAFTVPGGYQNDGPREGLPVFMRTAALQAFVFSDILAFCSSMAATVLLIYANLYSKNALKVYYALMTCYCISGVAILATITAFVTAVYVLTSKECSWLVVTSLLLGSAVPLFLVCYIWGVKIRNLVLSIKGLRMDFSQLAQLPATV